MKSLFFIVFREEKGTVLVYVGGYRFSKDSITGNKTRWRCSARHRTNCKAFVVTIEDNILRSCLDHNHEKTNFRKT